MKVQWIIVIILVVLILLALLIGVFVWARKPQVSIVRPTSGEEVVVVGKAPMNPQSRSSHGSSSPATYRQILGQLA